MTPPSWSPESLAAQAWIQRLGSIQLVIRWRCPFPGGSVEGIARMDAGPTREHAVSRARLEAGSREWIDLIRGGYVTAEIVDWTRLTDGAPSCEALDLRPWLPCALCGAAWDDGHEEGCPEVCAACGRDETDSDPERCQGCAIRTAAEVAS